jgi:hypothetical protein
MKFRGPLDQTEAQGDFWRGRLKVLSSGGAEHRYKPARRCIIREIAYRGLVRKVLES